MKNLSFLMASAAALSILCAATLTAQQNPVPISVTGYKQWTRVNAKPHRVASRLALLCRNLSPAEREQLASDPHNDKFVTVYVNPIARRAMLEQKKPTFPQGSLIVKEKWASVFVKGEDRAADDKTPELLTVMHKREKGFNPKNGDWEYLVYDGNGTQVAAQGKLSKCQSCHAQWKSTDYVSRVYLTTAMTHKLK